MRRIHALVLPVLRVAAAALLLAGCGGDDTSADDASASAGIDHVDGIVAVDGDGFVLTPIDGTDERSFTLGPEVTIAQVRAIEASGAPARVTFRGSEDDIASSVVPAPAIGDDLESYEGNVASVDSTTLVVDGADGTREFDISSADEGAFDVSHLQDHKSEKAPIAVYFDPADPGIGIAYEDA